MRLAPHIKEAEMHTGVDYVARTGTPIKASQRQGSIYRLHGYGKYKHQT